jgi:hypothetical protein
MNGILISCSLLAGAALAQSPAPDLAHRALDAARPTQQAWPRFTIR